LTRASELRGRVVVLSAHLDDAILSIGAAIARAVDDGADVRVVTVLAGDPDARAAAGSWDRAGGAASLADAAIQRRHEDAAACRIVGATPVWLPFNDMTYAARPPDDDIVAALTPHLAADILVVPGYPLTHPDHLWLASLARAHLIERIHTALYAEQPYTFHARATGASPGTIAPFDDSSWRWDSVSRSFRQDWRKRRAAASYRTQIGRLSDTSRLIGHMLQDERRHGGEAIAWPAGT
jgi:LmbE family N-acetylglucosaminyl deacetylase